MRPVPGAAAADRGEGPRHAGGRRAAELNAPLLAGATTPVALVVGLATWGFSAGLLATPMNAQAVEVEHRYGRPLMSSFHACFSRGVLGAACSAPSPWPGA
ncbi:hypothetical protein PJ985_20970 [Streptomyces sp. ACA25]|uniref:hypothetical protein n=1 Tax=Streptomyces sp. ACA25 TaxID=3022596 RepID=UPI002307B2FB|nr:hypothetical protein [Streptomyces sp. ACA25]MDB1090035.1 hypothetical protein [Streptomyces sp. ACA25]